jgi:threonine/homoserine/homoserine lactone efflux protein
MAFLLMMFYLAVVPLSVVLDLGVFFAGIVLTVVLSIGAVSLVLIAQVLRDYGRQIRRFLKQG